MRHDGAVSEPQEHRVATGLRAFTRFILFAGLGTVFVVVGVISVVRGAPWTVAAAYALLAGGCVYLATKVFPRRRAINHEPLSKPARRSGNPAVRASAEPKEGSDQKRGQRSKGAL